MQDRERILSALSHDMKNLVGAVDMNLQLIPLVLQSPSSMGSTFESGVANPSVGEFVERAHQATLGIGSLVDDVIAWFRLGDGRAAHSLLDDKALKPTLGQLAAQIRAEFTAPTRTQGLIFHLEMDGESSIEIAGGATATRVLRLILQHSLRFLFPKQKLTVRLWALKGGPFEFSVTTDQDALFDTQARSLAWLLAHDFAIGSGGTWGTAAATAPGDTISVRWV